MIRWCHSLSEAMALARLSPAQSLYSSDAWLELLRDHGHRYRYLLQSEGADPSALVLLTDGSLVKSGRYRPNFLLGERPYSQHCLIAGPLTGYHNELRSGPAGPLPRAMADGLLEAAEGGTVLLPYLAGSRAAPFEALGYPAGVIGWDAWLDVPETGFDGYLTLLSRKGRANVKGDLRHVEKSGLTFHTGTLSAPFEEMAELLVMHERKYDPGYDRPSSLFADYVARASQVPGAYAVVARHEGRTVGCHILFHYGDVLWARLIGVDESTAATRCCYFSLMFYEPLKFAHRLGVRSIHLGIGTSEAKMWRGARLEPLWTVAIAPPGRDRDEARQGIATRALDLPDPVPERVGPPPVSPSAWSARP